jgi:hypothetical protein
MAFETLQAKREASIIKGTSGQVKTLNKAVRSVASFANQELIITISFANVIGFSILQILK